MDTNLDITTLSIADQRALLGRDKTRLWSAEQDLAKIRADYQRQVVDHPHADIPELRARLDVEALPQLRAAEKAVADIAREVQDRARRVAVAAQKTARPMMTEAELRSAASHAPFDEMETRDLTVKQVADLVRSAIATNDKGHMYSLRKFAAKRLVVAPDERNTLKEDVYATHRAELSHMLGTIDLKLADPQFTVVAATAAEQADAAATLAHDAEKAARADRTSRPLYRFESPTDVPWTGA